MAEIKTKAEATSVDGFLDAVEHPVRRADGHAIRTMMERITGQPAVMWGPSIVGFGRYRYRYASGHQGEMCRIGFSPRKAELVFYVGAQRPEHADDLARLGKHKTGKGCLYVKTLTDVDPDALEAIVRRAYALPAEGELTT